MGWDPPCEADGVEIPAKESSGKAQSEFGMENWAWPWGLGILKAFWRGAELNWSMG